MLKCVCSLLHSEGERGEERFTAHQICHKLLNYAFDALDRDQRFPSVSDLDLLQLTPLHQTSASLLSDFKRSHWRPLASLQIENQHHWASGKSFLRCC